MKKLISLIMAAIICASLCVPLISRAVEFSVVEQKTVLYSNGKTNVHSLPDLNTPVVTTIPPGHPVEVTGITSNGWFRIKLEAVYYVPGYGLAATKNEEKTATEEDNANNAINTADVSALTKGTFSFFKNPKLGDFTKAEIEDMDDNTYIKYLDSYLMGYAMIENCFLRDKKNILKTVYDNEAKTDQKVAAMTMQAYLVNYRNDYLNNSLLGPSRSEKDLKLALNRAIRYNIGKFSMAYKSASVGDSESKMKKLVEGVISQIKAEQGVTFTFSMAYGSYKTKDNSEGTGWTIEFTKK